MKSSFWDKLNLKVWGTNLVQASSDESPERILGIYRPSSGEDRLVGRLFREQEEFVFRYDSDYDKDPISAFPKIDKEYRSKHLWPFFAVRIPPMDREDMQKEIERRSLNENQIIEILGSVARVSVTSPYKFKLVGD